MEHKIALIAACDRFNYGDVLLPIIFEEYCILNRGDSIHYDYYALKQSNLVEIGGVCTQSIANIDATYDAVIVCGGEVLTAQYVNMYLNLQNNKLIIFLFSNMSRVSYRITNCICKRLLHGKYDLPWCFFSLSKKQKVFYNGVGGGGIKHLRASQQILIRKIIEKSARFSVRDKVTYDALKDNDKVELLPDTAIIMSDLYPIKRLRSLISKKDFFKELDGRSYYVIQVNKRYGNDLVKELASSIRHINEMTGLKCVLLTIGRVQGHEDHVPLKKIYNISDHNYTFLFDEGNIYDIMYCIANSCAYIGTSLHGLITAAAYEIAHTVATPKAVKTLNFLKTWNTSSVLCVDNEREMMSYLSDSSIQNTVDIDKIHEMKALVSSYFDSVINRIFEDNADNNQ